MASTASTHPARAPVTVPEGGLARFDAGQPIIHRPGQVLMLRSGWAARRHELGDGRRQISALFLAGDLCDPLWLGSGGPEAEVVALTRVEATRIDSLPGEDALQTLAAGASLGASWTVNLGRRSALERLAHLFCELFVRSSRFPALAPRPHVVAMPLSVADLADATGLTAGHVQRLLTDLRTAGLATLARCRLTVPDFARLARTAQFDSASIPARPDWLRRLGRG